VRTSLGPAALFLGVLVLSGCAPGLGNLTGKPGPRPHGFGNTVESSDRRLSAALLAERVQPTADSHLQVAEEYRRLGLLDSAHDRLMRALAKEPRRAAVHEAVARIWRDWGMPASGLRHAHQAVYLAPRSASARNTLGTLLDALGQLDEAQAAYEAALALDQDAAWALNNLCYLAFRRGRLQEARAHCEAALQRAPTSVATHNNLALTYAAAGDMGQAHEEFRGAGDLAAAEYNLGMMHLANGEHAAAARAFEEAIKLRPDFTAAKTRAHAARLRLLTGRQ
jgi:tetratricopeptide (TPR) repeat protein